MRSIEYPGARPADLPLLRGRGTRAGRGVAGCSHGLGEIANIERREIWRRCDIISGEFEFESGGDTHARKRGEGAGFTARPRLICCQIKSERILLPFKRPTTRSTARYSSDINKWYDIQARGRACATMDQRPRRKGHDSSTTAEVRPCPLKRRTQPSRN